jgi:methylmalonyl-CoA mutase N-terminal domain/subunit
MEAGEKVVVGVNKFATKEKERFEVLKIDPALEAKQVEKLSAFKAKRDKDSVALHLEKIKEYSRTDNNMLPIFVEAVKAGLTVGEISDALREVWGEYVDRNN